MTTEEEQLLEEERLRREQESYPVARAPVYAGSPAADIDAANAAAPMQRSYVEPGQEARGFIAADVGPTGNVISGSYDSAPDDLRALQAHEAAIRYKGMQTYRSLLQGGATPAEAYRLAGADLNFSNPLQAMKLQMQMQKNQPKQPKPLETITKDGHTFYRTPTGGLAPLSGGDEYVKSSQRMLDKQIDDSRKQIAKDYTIATRADVDEDEKAAATRRVVAERGRLAKLEADYKTGSTNWTHGATSPAPGPNGITSPAPSPTFTQKSKEGFVMIGDPDRPSNAVTTKNPEGGFTIAKPGAASPFTEGATIRNKRDGKLYRVVNGVPVEVKE